MTVDKARELEVVEEQTEEEYVIEMVRLHNENRLYDADTGEVLEPEMTVSEMRATLDLPCIPIDQIDIPKDMGGRWLDGTTYEISSIYADRQSSKPT